MNSINNFQFPLIKIKLLLSKIAKEYYLQQWFLENNIGRFGFMMFLNSLMPNTLMSFLANELFYDFLNIFLQSYKYGLLCRDRLYQETCL